MARRPRRKSVVKDVQERCQVASRMGMELFHPQASPSEVCDRLARGEGMHLTEVERDAYDHLMPGTFRAAFATGWNVARLQAEHG